MDDVERAMRELDRLTSPAGRSLLAELRELDPSPADELRLAERLRRVHPAELVRAALAQHGLRRRAAAKFSGAARMWFTRDGLEQASGERVARHRGARFAGRGRVADLCCGLGGDLLVLAGEPREVWAVDRDPVHLRMALLNAEVCGVAERVRAIPADVREVRLDGVDAVFVDPARRSGPGGGSRRMRVGDSEPPLHWCAALAEQVPAVGVKAAPGLDRAAVPPGWEVEFVADGRELKEAALWSPALAGAGTRATVLPGAHQLLPDPAGRRAVADRAPGEYLLDPNPAVTRAGLVEELARRLDAWKIDPMIAFLSADRPLRTPFGRALRVLDSAPWRERELLARLRAHGIGALDVRRRGLAGDVEALVRRLRAALARGRRAGAGGGRAATLVMTRVADRPWALICVDDPDPGSRADPPCLL